MDLIALTVSEINGVTISPAVSYGVDVASIVEPISNNGVTSTVVVKIIDNIDSKASGLGNDTWEVSENLAAIVALSDHLFLCDVVSRRGETVSYQRIFYADRVVGGFKAVAGVTSFYYAEDGDPNLVLYGVSQTVAQIVNQTALSSSEWALGGNTVVSIKKFGTLDNFQVPFIVNSLEQMRLTLTGLGIGTNAPGFKLDVDSLVSELTAIARFANTKINFKIYASDATPEGAITADRGDLCVVDTGAVGQIYIKLTGAATNTGWSLMDTSASNDWNLDGNTVGSEKWIGTIDNFNFPVRTNNVEVAEFNTTGRFGLGDATNLNVSVGYGSNAVVNVANTALGIDALKSLVAGGGATDGIHNTGIGAEALKENTTGSYNTAIGRQTMQFNLTGEHNGAFGGHALYKNTTGSYNTACGVNALYENLTGEGNTAVGQECMRGNDGSSGYNTAVGFQALYSDLTSIGQNVAIGANALRTCGAGDWNVAVGTGAMYATTSGLYNVGIGYQALRLNTAGNFNTAIGLEAGYTNNADYNVFVGFRAGYYETGSDKLFIDNKQRASEADGRIKALIYGIFDAATANQRLRFNANVGIGGAPTATSILNVTGLPVAAAGLAAGDVWNNGGVLTIV
jgi:hypothetical protein